MAKAPVPGWAKSRLEPLIGPAGCARLQAALVEHTAATAQRVAPGAVFVAYAGDPALLRPHTGPQPRLFPQVDGDLGQRMTAAVAHVHATRAAPVVVIGTDCPVLDAAHVRAALDRLAAGADVVFGPARDGGYYLVALAAPAAAVFDLPTACWGGPDVLAASLAAAHAAGLTADRIGVERDLDTPADAAAMITDPRVPRAVAALLEVDRCAG